MISKLVIDTSILVKWLNRTNEKDIDKADKIMELALTGKIKLIAPELAKYELGNVLLKGKRLTSKEACISLGTAYSLPINFITESLDLAKKTYDIAYNFEVTYYDASFMALAKEQEADLITDNPKHQKKKMKGLKVISLKDY